MTDIYIFKNEKNFKIKVQETSKMGFDLVKNKLQELDFITHVPFTKSFIFHFNHLADVMLHASKYSLSICHSYKQPNNGQKSQRRQF